MTSSSHQPDVPPAPTLHPGAAGTSPAQWLEKYGDALWRFAISRVRDAQAAEDLVQEALTSALANQQTFAGQSAELTWLTGILHHKILDHFRRQARRNKRFVAAETDDGQSLVDSKFQEDGHWKQAKREIDGDATNLRLALTDCIAGLPENLEQAFVMREVQGVPPEQVCKVLKITSSNLWTRLSRARVLLRECLTHKGQSPAA